jgi:hypothetical protein
MNYLLLVILTICILVFLYCCYASIDTFTNNVPEYTSVHITQGTGDKLKETENVNNSLSTITDTSFREHSLNRKKIEGFKDLKKPLLSNPVSRQNIKCSNYVFSCEQLSDETSAGCALCYDDVNNQPKEGYLKTDHTLGKFNDCPCNFDNKHDCINYKLIRECKNIKSPFDLAVSMFDCGFVFTDPNGLMRNDDRGVHIDDNDNPININTVCALSNNATNPNHVIMPKISNLMKDKKLSTNIANKRVAIAKWIYDKFNKKSNYVDACQDELNDNGRLITSDCMIQIYRGVGGLDKGRMRPTSDNYKQRRANYRTVRSYQTYMQNLQKKANKTKHNLKPYTIKEVVDAKLALFGVVDCALADSLELTPENSEFLAQCYKNEYDNTYCLKDNQHYPSNPSNTLQHYSHTRPSNVLPAYKGKTFGDYKKFIRSVEDTLANARDDPQLYFKENTRSKFEYCFGRSYNIDQLNGGKFGHMQQMFDVAITHLYSHKLYNFVTLPFINLNEKTIKYQLRTAYDNQRNYLGNDASRIKIHAQGSLHFTREGTYYFKVTYDDIAKLIVDDGIHIKDILTSKDDTFRNRGVRYAYGKIKITKKHSLYPFNLILHQATGPGGIKFEYIRSNNENIEFKNISNWKVVNNEEQSGRLPHLRVVRLEKLTNVKSVSFFNDKNLTNIPVIELNNSALNGTQNYETMGYRGNLKNVDITPIQSGDWTLISNTNRNNGVYTVLDGNPDKEVNNNTSSGSWHIYRGKEYIKEAANNLFSGSKLFKEQEYPTFNIRNVKHIKFHLKQPLTIDNVQVYHPRNQENFRGNSEYYALHSNRNILNTGSDITVILPLYRYYKTDTNSSRIGHNSALVSEGIYRFALYPTNNTFNETENSITPDNRIKHNNNNQTVFN